MIFSNAPPFVNLLAPSVYNPPSVKSKLATCPPVEFKIFKVLVAAPVRSKFEFAAAVKFNAPEELIVTTPPP